jgi:3',5'-nucleoside bisphosphate phosphatase
VDTDIGHVLVYGSDRSVTDKISLKELRALFPEAALVWAHPFRNGKEPSGGQLTNPLLNGIEIFSLNHTVEENYRGLRAWHAFKFTALCGSDIHSEEKAGVFPTQFDHPVSTIQDVAREIRGARCRPFFKEIPKAGSDALVTEVTIGTKGSDELRHRIIVRHIIDDHKWKTAKKSVHLTERLHRHGFSGSSLFRVPRIIGVDESERLIIEEGQRGKSLFDVISDVSVEAGLRYFELSAHWLAELHNLRFRIDRSEDTMAKEEGRFAHYLNSFVETKNPHAETARRIVAFVKDHERTIIASRDDSFVQLHGDYHPKNIMIGRDKSHDPATQFISVIDFNNSLVFLPAFDVGYFLVQFACQMMGQERVLAAYTEDRFLAAYRSRAKETAPDFSFLVNLFKLRAFLSIASYFIKVGKGESPEITQIMRLAETTLQTAVASPSH